MSHRREPVPAPERPRLQVMLGVSAGWITITRFWAKLLTGWLAGAPISAFVGEGNLIVLNRSEVIHYGKKVLDKTESDDMGPPLLMLDTDILPQVSLQEALQIYAEDFQAGYDLVLSPTMKYLAHLAHTGKNPFMVMADPQDGSPLTGQEEGAFPIRAGGFGMVLMSPRIVRAFKPIRTWTYMDGESTVPVYCSNVEQTEDHDICQRVREMGFRLCADTRLVTEHHKLLPVLSYRAKPPKKERTEK